MIKISSPMLEDEEINTVIKVLKSGNISEGQIVKEFERDFADYIGVKYAAATSNGTTALFCTLLALGIKKGDEVITTPFTFIATANSILQTGAKPVFVDIDKRTFNINPDLLEAGISPRTRAIIPVHLYGQPCEMDKIGDIVDKHNLFVIEDACQAHGAEYKGKKAGSLGVAGCFSFYPTKNITTGEGGMVTTNDKELMLRIKELRNHGSLIRDNYKKIGYNFRMTNINAAMGIEQLKRLEGFNEKRTKNAIYLTNKLTGVRGIITPCIAEHRRHVFNQYTIRVTHDFGVSRLELIKRLEEKGIESRIYYPVPLHKQGLYRNLGYCLPFAENAAREVLSLPVHPKINRKDLDKIAGVIKQK